MKHLFTLLFLIVAFVQVSEAALSKEEKKQLKKELKNFRKHPEEFKSKMDNFKTTIDSNDAQIKRYKDDLTQAATTQVELEGKVADMDKKLKECEAKPVPVCPPAVEKDFSKAPTEGTIFKVQFGLYEKFSINSSLDKPKFMTYETIDGKNRYVLSYFETEEQAKEFVGDVRKMGIHDAFVSKYVDGKRVYEWNKNGQFKKTGKKSLQLSDDKTGN